MEVFNEICWIENGKISTMETNGIFLIDFPKQMRILLGDTAILLNHRIA